MKGSERVEDAELSRHHATVFAALYLRGVYRPVAPSVRRWPEVLHALRKGAWPAQRTPEELARFGFDEEAYALHDAELMRRAAGWVVGRRVLTAACPGYPTRWIERLHASAPPALWWNGVPFADRPGMSAVGSREIGPKLRAAMTELGAEAAEAGFLVVSGGAMGCDRAAVRGARSVWQASSLGEDCWPREAFSDEDHDWGVGGGHAVPAVEILPYGLEHAWAQRRPSPVAQLSVCEPWAEFTSAHAMERNALIYAWSSATIVGHARLREGGTWAGAADCLRRRLSKLLVLSPVPGVPHAPGNDALIRLGGVPLAGVGGIEQALATRPAQAAFEWDEPYGAGLGASPRGETSAETGASTKAKRASRVSELRVEYVA